MNSDARYRGLHRGRHELGRNGHERHCGCGNPSGSDLQRLRYSFDGVNATVIGCVGACASTVTIPDTIAVNAIDRPVVAIDSYALADRTALTHLSIGNNIRAIGLSAFQSDSALAEVTLGDSVESIDAMAFGFTPSLQAVTIPSSVTSINPRSFLEQRANGSDGWTVVTSSSRTSVASSSTSPGRRSFLTQRVEARLPTQYLSTP